MYAVEADSPLGKAFPPFFSFSFFNEKFQLGKVTLTDVICLVKLLYGSERKEY